MPAVPEAPYQKSSPCWEKMKYHFAIGFCVGLASSAMYTGFFSLRYGLRGRELVNNVGKAMLQTGVSFGSFMAIGGALRC